MVTQKISVSLPGKKALTGPEIQEDGIQSLALQFNIAVKGRRGDVIKM